MKILVAEDDRVSEILMTTYLKDFGECVSVANGRDAVVEFEKNFDLEPFDLICLDIMMPIMSGYEALEAIRRIEEKKGVSGLDRTKVIMTTALDQKDDIMKAFNTGCEAYLVKPVSKTDIEETLKSLGMIC